MRNLIARKPEDVTPAIVLKKVKELISIQQRRKGISLDSLSLILGLKSEVIKSLVKELADQHLLLWQIPETTSNRGTGMGTVSLV